MLICLFQIMFILSILHVSQLLASYKSYTVVVWSSHLICSKFLFAVLGLHVLPTLTELYFSVSRKIWTGHEEQAKDMSNLLSKKIVKLPWQKSGLLACSSVAHPEGNHCYELVGHISPSPLSLAKVFTYAFFKDELLTTANLQIICFFLHHHFFYMW